MPFFGFSGFLVALLALLVCPLFAGYVASQKDRSFGNWFLFGLVGRVFALIAIAGIPPQGGSAGQGSREP